MRVERLVVGPLQVNCWIVGDDHGGPVLVIDPGDDAPAVLDQLAGRHVRAIVLTHAHFDHVGGVDELRTKSGAPLAIHADDAGRLHDVHSTGAALFGMTGTVSDPPEMMLADGDVIAAGDLTVRVLHTPGHSAGGICLLASDGSGAEHLFSGDTLFAGSVGRTDFAGGDARRLRSSIATQLAPLAPQTAVHPGHGPDTTIEREARLNPFWPRA